MASEKPEINTTSFNSMQSAISISALQSIALFTNNQISIAKLLPPKHPKYHGKHTLILDLDNTIVHSSVYSSGKNEVQVPVLNSIGAA